MNKSLSFMIVFILVAISMIPWFTHILMMLNEKIYYGWAGFKQFKRELNKMSWNMDEKWNTSLFNYQDGGYTHADIFKFNDKGMIINNPISFYLCKNEIRKYIKTNFKPKSIKIRDKRNIVDWK